MSKFELVKKLYEIGSIKFGDFTLKSGKKSPYYIDLRILPSYPKILIEAGRATGEVIKGSNEKVNRLCGIPMAGLAIANMVGVEINIPVLYTRKEPVIYTDLIKRIRGFIQEGKYTQEEIQGINRVINTIEELSGLKTHGITRYVDGVMLDGDRIGIVDDLITTAESKLEARDLIMLEAERRNIKVSVTGVYVLVDREQGGKEALQEEGIQLHSVLTITEIMNYLHKIGTIDSKKYETIMAYITSEKQDRGR
jgi:uridine monophosphate synthetase